MVEGHRWAAAGFCMNGMTCGFMAAAAVFGRCRDSPAAWVSPAEWVSPATQRQPGGVGQAEVCMYYFEQEELILADYLYGVVVAARGVPVTLVISLVAVFGGLIIGLLVAIAKRSGYKILRAIGTIYVDILRGTPLLVQVLILAYGVPQLLKSTFGMQFNWPHMIIVGFIACGINSSAYMAEIIRSGLQAIDIGQTEAARSLGMSKGQTMRYVVIPQAFKIIVPAMGNEFVTLIKETSILSVAGIVEVTRRGTLWASSSFLSFQAYIGVAVVYLVMTLTLSRLVAYIERRLAQSDRG